MKHDQEIEMLDYDKERIVSEETFNALYIKKIRTITLFVLLTLASYVIGFNNFTDEANEIWFQRSGSLIVIFSVCVEISHMRIKTMVNKTLIDYGNGNITTRMVNFKQKHLPPEYSDPEFNILYEPFILFSAICGTVIWGYGDLLYVYFH